MITFTGGGQLTQTVRFANQNNSISKGSIMHSNNPANRSIHSQLTREELAHQREQARDAESAERLRAIHARDAAAEALNLSGEDWMARREG